MDIRTRIATAIRSVQSKVRWRPGSAASHLHKRKLRGHLPPDATLGDYERVIVACLQDPSAQVYTYRHHDVPYVAVVAVIEGRHWLVMFALDGLMESAYVVERAERYLNRPTFQWIGLLSEVLT